MPTPAKPRKKVTNQPLNFQEILAPTMPLAPVIPQINAANRGLMVAGSIFIAAILMGILSGLMLRSAFNDAVTIAPGDVARVTSPQYARIAQAKAMAVGGQQSIQISRPTSAMQPAQTVADLQPGRGINALQPGLSAYDAQGAVGGPAR